MNQFETIDSTTLENINGGNRGRAIGTAIKKGAEYAGKAGKWAWNDVIKPGLIWSGAERLIGGGGQQQQPAQPAQPAQPGQ